MTSDFEIEKQLRGFLQKGHELSNPDEILENLDNARDYLSEKNKSTKTSALDGKKHRCC